MNTLLSMIARLRRHARHAAHERRSRAEFNMLDDATLRDLGLTRTSFPPLHLEPRHAQQLPRRRVRAGAPSGLYA